MDTQGQLGPARLLTICCCLALMGSLVPRGGWPIVALAAATFVDRARGRRPTGPPAQCFARTVLNIHVLVTRAAVLTGGP